MPSPPTFFRPARCSPACHLLGRTVGAARPALDRLHVDVLWKVAGDKSCASARPQGWYRLVGGVAISALSICLEAAPSDAADVGQAGLMGPTVDDPAEHDPAEHDPAEHDAAEHDAAEHDAAVAGTSPTIGPDEAGSNAGQAGRPPRRRRRAVLAATAVS